MDFLCTPDIAEGDLLERLPTLINEDEVVDDVLKVDGLAGSLAGHLILECQVENLRVFRPFSPLQVYYLLDCLIFLLVLLYSSLLAMQNGGLFFDCLLIL